MRLTVQRTLTDTPAAHAALKISLFFPSLSSYLVKQRETMFPTQHAICTKGPSFPKYHTTVRTVLIHSAIRDALPRDIPLATLKANPKLLTNNVEPPRYPRMINPDRMVLTSVIPEPEAK
jgi:hypothetical protein